MVKIKRQRKIVTHTPHILCQYAGAVISARRKMLGLSGEQLGQLVGVSQQQISRYEQGVSNITLPKLERLSAALGMSLRQFMGEFILLIETNGTDFIDDNGIPPYLNHPRGDFIDTITAEVLGNAFNFKNRV